MNTVTITQLARPQPVSQKTSQFRRTSAIRQNSATKAVGIQTLQLSA